MGSPTATNRVMPPCLGPKVCYTQYFLPLNQLKDQPPYCYALHVLWYFIDITIVRCPLFHSRCEHWRCWELHLRWTQHWGRGRDWGPALSLPISPTTSSSSQASSALALSPHALLLSPFLDRLSISVFPTCPYTFYSASPLGYSACTESKCQIVHVVGLTHKNGYLECSVVFLDDLYLYFLYCNESFLANISPVQ